MSNATAHSVNGIPVTAESGIDIKTALAAKPFTDWLASVDTSRFTVSSIHFQSMDMFGPRVGFVKFKCDVTDSQGKFLPGIIFARGGAVAVIALLECEGEHHAVVTVQPRLATGDFEFVEVCAGMLDGSGNFAGVAAKELKEELGIELDEDDLTDLSTLAGYPDGVYLSPGACEETIRFFAFCKSVSREELDDINGRLTGALDENEQITVKLVKVDDLVAVPDAKTIVAHSLLVRFGDQIPGYSA
ncbi:MAG: NUDIX domain-containing protein [Cyanobacteriota/Melainabacteria group bacterium]|nr:NUDIX domain-containing protein [Cyanobacteria bacterium HKST-UBA01]MCB9466756.1 NUDIX domain-containing protein [Candidatus Obscuribacterales bacterium]